MTHKDQIDAAVRDYGSMPRSKLPGWLRNPRSEHEFNLALSVATAGEPGVSPTYDTDGFLTGWQGIRLKDAR